MADQLGRSVDVQIVVAESTAGTAGLGHNAAVEPGIPPSVVKSAGRALQILEFFDVIQREACVSDISASLHYPQSSTSVLLRSLVAMGYLRHDRVKRTYFPTRRVCLLGNWVDPSLIQHGALLAMADRLSVETGEIVVMATVNGLNSQYIYAQNPTGGPAVPTIGAMLPLARTAVGHALLSVFDDAHIGKLLRRANAERRDWDEPINISACMAELNAGRKRCWFTGPGAGRGDLAIATTADSNKDGHLLAIGIEGADYRIEDKVEALAQTLRREMGWLSSLPTLLAA
jgi:DNA-binding IclR family transcriptional regulator